MKTTCYMKWASIEHSYQTQMSWQRYGTGTASMEVRLNGDGLTFVCNERPESGRGGKETWVSLDAKAVAELKELIAVYESKQRNWPEGTKDVKRRP